MFQGGLGDGDERLHQGDRLDRFGGFGAGLGLSRGRVVGVGRVRLWGRRAFVQRVAGGVQGGQVGRAVFGAEPDRDGQGAVVVPVVAVLGSGGHLVVFGQGGGPAKAGDETVEVSGGGVQGYLHQVGLGGGGRDPGDRPGLGIAEPARGERGGSHRQVGHGVCDAQMFAGGRQAHSAAPGQPVRARAHSGAAPAFAGVERGEQHQEPAGRGGQVTGQGGDLGLEGEKWHLVNGCIEDGVPGGLDSGWGKDSSGHGDLHRERPHAVVTKVAEGTDSAAETRRFAATY